MLCQMHICECCEMEMGKIVLKLTCILFGDISHSWLIPWRNTQPDKGRLTLKLSYIVHNKQLAQTTYLVVFREVFKDSVCQ